MHRRPCRVLLCLCSRSHGGRLLVVYCLPRTAGLDQHGAGTLHAAVDVHDAAARVHVRHPVVLHLRELGPPPHSPSTVCRAACSHVFSPMRSNQQHWRGGMTCDTALHLHSCHRFATVHVTAHCSFLPRHDAARTARRHVTIDARGVDRKGAKHGEAVSKPPTAEQGKRQGLAHSINNGTWGAVPND